MSIQCDDIIDDARRILALDRLGMPCANDTQAIFSSMNTLRQNARPEVFDELVTRGFLVGAAERYATYIAADMRAIPAVRYEMGTPPDEVGHFCGESPHHEVALSPFAASAYAVTNSLYATFDPRSGNIPSDERFNPVTDVTWFDATVFAWWVGCRLPTEAEWEYLCGGGGRAQWCCADEHKLAAYAWYSENAEDRAHPVGTRMPNMLDMYDMHGNVWEWCADDYSDTFYASAPRLDPLNDHVAGNGTAPTNTHRVSRGGGFYALAEMCRTRYRLHDPDDYYARDLGFRLVHGVQTLRKSGLMLNLQLTADLASCLPPVNGNGQGRSRSIVIDASDWPGVVAEVKSRFPVLANRIFAENGALQQGFLVAINSELIDIRVTPMVRAGDELFVFPQISGG